MSRRKLGIFIALAACGLLRLGSASLSEVAAQQPGFSQIDVHNPFSPNYVPMTPLRGTFRSFSTGTYPGTTYTFYSTPGFYPPGILPFYAGYPALGPYYGAPLWGGTVVAPLVMPPGTLFGPQAMMRFMGVDGPYTATPAWQLGSPPPAAQQGAAPQQGAGAAQAADGAPQGADAPIARGGAKPRVSNADARARSQRYIVLGDGYFAKQQYSDANQRYRTALQAAPDMPDGYMRQGLALIALGNYEAAARTLKRGLQIDPSWPDSDFTLNALYDKAGLAKAAHIEALRQEAAHTPSADMLFLLGVMLYFDAQRPEAARVLERARALAAGDDAHIVDFLRLLAPQLPANNGAAKGGAANAVPAAASGPGTDPLALRDGAPPRGKPIAPFSALPAPEKVTRPAAAPASPVLPRGFGPAPSGDGEAARDL